MSEEHPHEEHPHEEHPHEEHPHINPSSGGKNGSPKVSFIFGLLVGLAICIAVVLIFAAWSITSGKSLTHGAASAVTQTTASAPTGAASANSNTPKAATGTVKPVNASIDHIRGAKNAKVTLIEYADFECPFCKKFESSLGQALKDFPKSVRVVYRYYPLSFHKNAEKEAEASECVASLGGNNAFWKFHDLIYQRTTSNGTGFALTALGPLAKEVGVNQTKFQSCLNSGKYAKLVAQEKQDGTAAGVTGTPTTFVNGRPVSGAVPYSQLKVIIQSVIGT